MSIDSLTPRVKQHSMTVSATDNTSTAARPPRHGDAQREKDYFFRTSNLRSRTSSHSCFFHPVNVSERFRNFYEHD
ncbi:hypothetical protein TrVFT333_008907 [Trichoderma virens FT-333]|nr:hypothetical protein TrVFT333_008907 [Trichoderma virens FT-333]